MVWSFHFSNIFTFLLPTARQTKHRFLLISKHGLPKYRNKLALLASVSHCSFLYIYIICNLITQASLPFCHSSYIVPICVLHLLRNLPTHQFWTITVLFTFGSTEWHEMSCLKLSLFLKSDIFYKLPNYFMYSGCAWRYWSGPNLLWELKRKGRSRAKFHSLL